MTTDPTPADTAQAELQRDENDDDLDLLTYKEARARLSQELSTEERLLADLRQRLSSSTQSEPDAQALHAREQRVEALREALSRTARPAITSTNTTAFYGSHLASEQA